MITSRIQPSPLVTTPLPFPRVINVVQNLFPGSPFSGTMVDLGKWGSEPKALVLGDKSFAVTHVASRGRGQPFDRYTVVLPKLEDGQHTAVVKLANGAKMPVVLNVSSVH